MRFAQTTTTLDATLTLPLSTGEYTIPAISAKDGLVLKELNAAFEEIARRVQAGEDQTAVTEETVEKRGLDLDDLQRMEELCLSRDLREQMIDDGAGLREVEIAGMTAFLFHTVNDEGKAAEAYWTSGGKAPRPNRAQRRTATQTRQVEGTTTQTPASRTGTTRKAAASRKKASDGKTSSSTGTSSKRTSTSTTA